MSFVPEFHSESRTKSDAAPANFLSYPLTPECGQNSQPFVPINVDKTHGEGFVLDWDKTILSSKQTHETSKHDIDGMMNLQICGQKDKTGQNLKEKEKVKEKEKDKNSFSGCAANIDKLDKTRDQDFCPTWDKTPQHDICWDKSGQNPVSVLSQLGQNPNHDFSLNPLGQKVQTILSSPLISESEAAFLMEHSGLPLYKEGNKLVMEDDDREWVIIK